MKRIFVVLLIVAMSVIIAGCFRKDLPEPSSQEKIVIVERYIPSFSTDQGIEFSCKSAILDYDGRRLILEEVKQVGVSSRGIGWIGDISIEGNKLIFKIPSDTQYTIYIGKQEHILPELVTDK